MMMSYAIDSRKSVQNLVAMMKEREPIWFYTHTCNQSAHFGIAPIHELLIEQLEDLKSNIHDISAIWTTSSNLLKNRWGLLSGIGIIRKIMKMVETFLVSIHYYGLIKIRLTLLTWSFYRKKLSVQFETFFPMMNFNNL